MNNGTEGSLKDHLPPASRAWASIARAALLALAMLALVVPITAQVATAAGPAAPAVAPQQAGEDGEGGGEDGEAAQDGEDGEETAGATEEDDNNRFYILLGVFSFVLMAFVGIVFAVFGYVGSGR